MGRRFAVAALGLLAAGACAQTRVEHVDPNTPPGAVYYEPKPHLLVKRRCGSDEVLEAKVVILPDLDNPHYVVQRPGFGKSAFKLDTKNGMLSTYDQDLDAKATGVFKDLADAFQGIVAQQKANEEALKQARANANAAPAASTAAAPVEAVLISAQTSGLLKDASRRLDLVETFFTSKGLEKDEPEKARRKAALESARMLVAQTRDELERAIVVQRGAPTTCAGLLSFVALVRRLRAVFCTLEAALPEEAIPEEEKEKQTICQRIGAFLVALEAGCAPTSAAEPATFGYLLFEIVFECSGKISLRRVEKVPPELLAIARPCFPPDFETCCPGSPRGTCAPLTLPPSSPVPPPTPRPQGP